MAQNNRVKIRTPEREDKGSAGNAKIRESEDKKKMLTHIRS